MLSEQAIDKALSLALEAGDRARGFTSPNPPVGAAILDSSGTVVGVGSTQPVGGDHAEIQALARAGERARGGTAVVTLEPCNHVGRTGACSVALIDAGVARVIYIKSDPFPAASGGAESLRAHGITVEQRDRDVPALVPWLRSVVLHRPHVTLKFAQTVDGCVAASDGTSQWITGPAARAQVHLDRSRRDAIVVGTGTVITDNPSLTARTTNGLYPTQPKRVVIGSRTVPRGSHLDRLGYEQYEDIDRALQELWGAGCRDVLVEGGPKLSAAFLQADLVDAVQAYIAPALLGAGRSVLSSATATTMADITRMKLTSTRILGEDLLVELQRKEP